MKQSWHTEQLGKETDKALWGQSAEGKARTALRHQLSALLPPHQSLCRDQQLTATHLHSPKPSPIRRFWLCASQAVCWHLKAAQAVCIEDGDCWGSAPSRGGSSGIECHNHRENEAWAFKTHQSAAPSFLEEIKGMGCPTGRRERSTGTSGSALLLQFKVKHLLCTHFWTCLSLKLHQVIRIIRTIIRP